MNEFDLKKFMIDKLELEKELEILDKEKELWDSNPLIQRYKEFKEKYLDKSNTYEIDFVDNYDHPRIKYIVSVTTDKNGKIDREETFRFDNCHTICLVCGDTLHSVNENDIMIFKNNSNDVLITSTRENKPSRPDFYEIVKYTFDKLVMKGLDEDRVRILTQDILQNVVNELQIEKYDKKDESQVIKLVKDKLDRIK